VSTKHLFQNGIIYIISVDSSQSWASCIVVHWHSGPVLVQVGEWLLVVDRHSSCSSLLMVGYLLIFAMSKIAVHTFRKDLITLRAYIGEF
jgi:hypothetical protein